MYGWTNAESDGELCSICLQFALYSEAEDMEFWLELPGRGHPVSVTDHDCALLMHDDLNHESDMVNGLVDAATRSLDLRRH